MTRHRVLFIIIAVATLLTVVVLGFVYVAKRESPTPSVSEEPSERRERDPVTYLVGTVKSVSEGAFVLEVQYPEFSGAEAFLSERTVTVDPTTRITLVHPKDVSIAEREAQEFDAKVSEYEEQLAGARARGLEDPAPPVPSLPISIETVGADSLAPGQTVSVVTEADVRTEQSFEAVSVDVLSDVNGTTRERAR